MSTQPPPPENETTLADVKQLGLWASIGSLSYVFWIVGGMEMIERLAYYGVRAVATIYATRPVSENGLGVTMATFGWLLLCWNLAQSLIPIFTGGRAGRRCATPAGSRHGRALGGGERPVALCGRPQSGRTE